MPRYAASDLGLKCLPMSQLIWVNTIKLIGYCGCFPLYGSDSVAVVSLFASVCTDYKCLFYPGPCHFEGVAT